MEANINNLPHARPHPGKPRCARHFRKFRKFRSTRSWMIIALAALAAVALSGLCSADPPQYAVLVLDLPDYVGAFYPWSLNDKAEIVGTYYIGGGGLAQPFLWERGQFVPLELPVGYQEARCYKINATGQIAGTMGGNVAPTRAFVIDDGEWTDLGTLQGGNFSWATDMNDLIQVVGYWGDNVDADPPIQAFFWDDGVMTNLGPDFPLIKSRAHGINNHSQITGETGLSFGNDTTAFIWENGNVVDIGPIPGGSTSVGLGINNSGDVAGRGIMPDWSSHGFFFHGGEMIDIGLAPGATRCYVYDMNDSAEIVGECDEYPDGPDDWAFVWRDGIMYVLNDLIPPGLGLNLKWSYAINNAGQITATGHQGVKFVGVLLTPINPRPADVNKDNRVDIEDLFEVLAGWGPCPEPPQVCPADVDGDASVDVNDIFTVLADWG